MPAPNPQALSAAILAAPAADLTRLSAVLMFCVQDGILKSIPSSLLKDGTIGASPVVVSLASLGFGGLCSLLVQPDTSNACTILVELSRDGGSTYVAVNGGAPFVSDNTVLVARRPTDTAYATHVRMTRSAGAGTLSRYVITNNIAGLSSIQDSSRGHLDNSPLVVDGTTRMAFPDQATYGGRTWDSLGLSNNIIAIRSEVYPAYAWDESNGRCFFSFMRMSNASVFCEAYPSVALASVASQSAMLAITVRPDTTAVQVDDYVLRTDLGTTWTLTTAGPSTLAHWTQNAGSVPGGVTVLNQDNVAPRLGQIVTVFRLGPNVWSVA